jgi:hypothetical protein
MTNQPDPSKVKVQLNLPVTWEVMNHLDRIAHQKRVSKAQLVREAIDIAYPEIPERIAVERAKRARQETRDAGSTQ